MNPDRRPLVVHLGKSRFSLPPSSTLRDRLSIEGRSLRQVCVATGPAGPHTVADVDVLCLPCLRPAFLGGLLFYTFGPLLALLIALARRASAIVCQSPYEGVGVLALSRAVLPRRIRPPVQIEIHGDWRAGPRLYGSRSRVVLAPLTDRLSTWAIRRADRVRAVGEATATLVAGVGYRGPVDRYPTYSNYAVFTDPPVAPLPDIRRVVFAGVLERCKGVDVLLDAWPTVLDAVPDGQLTIVGAGSAAAELMRRSSAVATDHRVRFLDPVPQAELRSLLDNSTCLVLPSRAEGLPRIIVEAMARGRPVVASDVGGIPELVDDGSTGLLVPPDDPGALAGALTDMLSDPWRAERMGRAARRWVERLDPGVQYEAGVERLAEWIRSSGRGRPGVSPSPTASGRRPARSRRGVRRREEAPRAAFGPPR